MSSAGRNRHVTLNSGMQLSCRTLLTFWPPAPPLRMVVISRSDSGISTSFTLSPADGSRHMSAELCDFCTALISSSVWSNAAGQTAQHSKQLQQKQLPCSVVPECRDSRQGPVVAQVVHPHSMTSRHAET
jgi:hypothetical protein